jgi:peptide/nickel transport system ATP-binding protein
MTETLHPPTARDASRDHLLSVERLFVSFGTADGQVHAVNDVSFDLDAGETLAIVGESGSGKSVTGQAIMGLHRQAGTRVSGRVMFQGTDLTAIPERQLRQIRGDGLAMVFQDPLSAFHSYYTIGDQIIEAIRLHRSVSRRAARARAIEVLDFVGIPSPEVRVDEYPHEFSGGMRQRAMIAMAMVNDPKVLIADEPTTALDVTVQLQILELMGHVQKELGTAVIMITHDLGVVAEIADRVLIMYAGSVSELGPTEAVLQQPQHPYTAGLLGSLPRIDLPRQDRLEAIPGSPPSMLTLPTGCAFHPRCSIREESAGCFTRQPELEPAGPGRSVRCHLALASQPGAPSNDEVRS